MQILLNSFSALWRKIFALSLVTLIGLSGLFLFFQQPSYAATATSNQLSREEEIDRAYEYRQGAGEREEIYQKRLEEGQNPEKMPKPFERILDLNEQKEVPETSLVEKSVSKVREIIEGETSQ